MQFSEFYRSNDPVISFELFPPKTEKGFQNLERRLPKLIELEPSFLTVTYGAMGTTRAKTLALVSKIKNEFGMEAAHHLTCVGSDSAQVEKTLKRIRAAKIENIVALRGDPPQGKSHFQAVEGGYRYALQLVEHIRDFGGFGIAVAGYPEKHIEAPDLKTDLAFLKKKVDAGADVVITQLFYDNRAFFEFERRCRDLGLTQPIIPGLLPIMNLSQIKRITTMCGSTIPESLLAELQAVAEDDDKVTEIGIRHSVEQSRELLASGVPGIHFYVLNQYAHISEVVGRLKDQLTGSRS